MALRTPLTAQPHLYIGDSTGRPLDYGRVYFGEPNKDPEFYPIDIYLDPEMTIAAAQPVRTKGGFMDVGGNLAELHAAEVIYSLKVLDQYGRQVFYKPEMYRNNVSDFLVDEITRATAAETLISGNLTAETQRAVAAEKVIADAVVAEKDRAVAAEDALDIKHAALSSTINSLGGGKKAYTTYALMVADKNNIAANSSIDVTNDTDPLKNGTYSYNGAVFAKSIYDVETIVRTKVLNTFKTKSLMDANALPDGADAQVTNDTANNGLYVKTAGAWVKSSYDPLALAKKYIDAIGVIKLNKNLTDFTVKNKGISLVTGGEISAPTYSSTGFIPVKSGSNYEYSARTTATVGGAWYNKDKVFIASFGSSLSGSEVVSATAPEEAKYVRITNLDANSYPVFFRSVGYEYSKEELKRVIDDIDYDRAKNPLLEVRYGGDYFTVADTYVHKGTGVTSALADWSSTPYLKILPNTSYQINSGSTANSSGFAWYDKNKEFIDGGAVNSLAKFTSPNNAAYIKMTAANHKKEISGLYSEQPSYNIEKLLDILDTHLDIDISSDSSGGGSDIAADTIVNSKKELQEVNPYGNSDRAYPIGRRVYDHSLRKEVIADGMFWRLPDGTAASLAPRVYVYPDWDEIRKALPYYAKSYTPVYNVSQGVSAWTEGDNVKSVMYKGSKWLSITHSSGTNPYVILKDNIALNNKYLIFDYWVDLRVTDNVRLGLFNTNNELLFSGIVSSSAFNGKGQRPLYDVEHLKIELDMSKLTPVKEGALLSDVSKIGFNPSRKANEETTIYIGNIDCVSFKPKITIRFDDQWAGVYDNAYPIMERHGLTGLIAVVTGNPNLGNSPDYSPSSSTMSKAELLEVQSEGWDLVSHTHTHMASEDKSDEYIRNNYQLSTAYLRDELNVGEIARSCLISPYSRRPERAAMIQREFFDCQINKTHINSQLPRQPDGTWSTGSLWSSMGAFTGDTKDSATLISYAEQTIAEQGWGIFMFHEVQESSAGLTYASIVTLTAEFDLFCQWLAANKDRVDVVTVTDVVKQIRPDAI